MWVEGRGDGGGGGGVGGRGRGHHTPHPADEGAGGARCVYDGPPHVTPSPSSGTLVIPAHIQEGWAWILVVGVWMGVRMGAGGHGHPLAVPHQHGDRYPTRRREGREVVQAPTHAHATHALAAHTTPVCPLFLGLVPVILEPDFYLQKREREISLVKG